MSYQPTMAEVNSYRRHVREKLFRWYMFRIFLGISSLWFGFVLFPMFNSMGMDISPLDAVRNGNVIVFVAVLSASSMGLFLEVSRISTWRIATYHFVALIIILLIAAVHIPLFTLPQAKTAPKTVVYILSAALFIITVWLARNIYVMTLLNQEPLNEEDERRAEDRREIAEERTKSGDTSI